MNSMLFEGDDLEEVLAEARLCFGPEMQVEAANRVRRGGLFGFFATEWFEVWAQPPETEEDPILALLERESMEDDEGDEPFSDIVRKAIASGRSTTPAGPTSEERYAETLDEFFGGNAGPEPLLSEGLHPDLTAVAAPTASATATAVVDAPPVERTIAPSPALAMTALSAESTPAAVALEDSPRGKSVFEAATPTTAGLLWAMLDRLETIPEPPAVPSGSAVVAFVGEASAARAAARRMGEATGLWNGDVVVLSRHRDLDDVPSWLHISDLDDAASRAERWRQRSGPVPIVIDQSVDAGDRAWATKALTALAADQVRLVTEAWRLPSDIGSLSGRLGGVDVLDLVEVDDAIEPLAMLDLDIPVGTVQGRPATPDLLAAVWLEKKRRG